MDLPCLAVQQEVIGVGQMSWRLNLHRQFEEPNLPDLASA